MMIEALENASKLKICCDIWLAASKEGHGFIDGNFWQEKYHDMLDLYLPNCCIHGAYINGVLVGFSATSGDTLEALFVHPDMWGQGVGKALLSFLSSIHDVLRLSVYEKNERATNFYKRFGFIQTSAGICPHTNENELHMEWGKTNSWKGC